MSWPSAFTELLPMSNASSTTRMDKPRCELGQQPQHQPQHHHQHQQYRSVPPTHIRRPYESRLSTRHPHRWSTKAGTKKSFVWKYFFHPELSVGVRDLSHTQCILCTSQLAFNTSGTTTTMLNHLKSRHNEVVVREQQKQLLLPVTQQSSYSQSKMADYKTTMATTSEPQPQHQPLATSLANSMTMHRFFASMHKPWLKMHGLTSCGGHRGRPAGMAWKSETNSMNSWNCAQQPVTPVERGDEEIEIARLKAMGMKHFSDPEPQGRQEDSNKVNPQPFSPFLPSMTQPIHRKWFDELVSSPGSIETNRPMHIPPDPAKLLRLSLWMTLNADQLSKQHSPLPAPEHPFNHSYKPLPPPLIDYSPSSSVSPNLLFSPFKQPPSLSPLNRMGESPDLLDRDTMRRTSDTSLRSNQTSKRIEFSARRLSAPAVASQWTPHLWALPTNAPEDQQATSLSAPANLERGKRHQLNSPRSTAFNLSPTLSRSGSDSSKSLIASRTGIQSQHLTLPWMVSPNNLSGAEQWDDTLAEAMPNCTEQGLKPLDLSCKTSKEELVEQNGCLNDSTEQKSIPVMTWSPQNVYDAMMNPSMTSPGGGGGGGSTIRRKRNRQTNGSFRKRQEKENHQLHVLSGCAEETCETVKPFLTPMTSPQNSSSSVSPMEHSARMTTQRHSVSRLLQPEPMETDDRFPVTQKVGQSPTKWTTSGTELLYQLAHFLIRDCHPPEILDDDGFRVLVKALLTENTNRGNNDKVITPSLPSTTMIRDVVLHKLTRATNSRLFDTIRERLRQSSSMQKSICAARGSVGLVAFTAEIWSPFTSPPSSSITSSHSESHYRIGATNDTWVDIRLHTCQQFGSGRQTYFCGTHKWTSNSSISSIVRDYDARLGLTDQRLQSDAPTNRQTTNGSSRLFYPIVTNDVQSLGRDIEPMNESEQPMIPCHVTILLNIVQDILNVPEVLQLLQRSDRIRLEQNRTELKPDGTNGLGPYTMTPDTPTFLNSNSWSCSPTDTKTQPSTFVKKTAFRFDEATVDFFTNASATDRESNASIPVDLLRWLDNKPELDAEEAVLARRILAVIKPIFCVLYLLLHTNELTLTASAIRPIVHNLLLRFEELTMPQVSSRALTLVLTNIGKKLRKSYPQTGPVYQVLSLATFFDPRFCRLSPESTATREEIQSILLEMHPLNGLESEYSPDVTASKVADELDRFIHEPVVDVRQDPSNWWNERRENFPILSELASSYLPIPAYCFSRESPGLEDQTGVSEESQTGQLERSKLSLPTERISWDHVLRTVGQLDAVWQKPLTRQIRQPPRKSTVMATDRADYGFLWHNWKYSRVRDLDD